MSEQPPPTMRYAHQPDVLKHLAIKSTTTDVIARVVRMENGLADAFDQRCGRSFGMTGVLPVSRVVLAQDSAMLTPSIGMREVTTIRYRAHATGGWTLLDPDRYELIGEGADGSYQSVFLPGGHWGNFEIEITGHWADRDYEAVPEDVREAMTFITVRQYRRQNASPTEMIGPDGLYVPAPHAWDDPMVRAAINRHRVHRRRIGV